MTVPADSFTLYDGSQMVILDRPARPADPLVMRFHLVNGGGSPPPHVHPRCSETFEVEQGSLELLSNDEWTELGEGESVTVEAGQRHSFRNRSGATTVLRNVHDPHHDFEAYIRTAAALSHEYEMMAPRSPGAALRFSLLLSRHSDLIQPTDQPLRTGVPMLAALARVLRVSLPDPI